MNKSEFTNPTTIKESNDLVNNTNIEGSFNRLVPTLSDTQSKITIKTENELQNLQKKGINSTFSNNERKRQRFMTLLERKAAKQKVDTMNSENIHQNKRSDSVNIQTKPFFFDKAIMQKKIIQKLENLEEELINVKKISEDASIKKENEMLSIGFSKYFELSHAIYDYHLKQKSALSLSIDLIEKMFKTLEIEKQPYFLQDLQELTRTVENFKLNEERMKQIQKIMFPLNEGSTSNLIKNNSIIKSNNTVSKKEGIEHNQQNEYALNYESKQLPINKEFEQNENSQISSTQYTLNSTKEEPIFYNDTTNVKK